MPGNAIRNSTPEKHSSHRRVLSPVATGSTGVAAAQAGAHGGCHGTNPVPQSSQEVPQTNACLQSRCRHRTAFRLAFLRPCRCLRPPLCVSEHFTWGAVWVHWRKRGHHARSTQCTLPRGLLPREAHRAVQLLVCGNGESLTGKRNGSPYIRGSLREASFFYITSHSGGRHPTKT